jgi:calcineurin-like phosphoesterase family protein
MKTWLSADYHFGEDRFELMGRPFTNVHEHNGAIIANHNAVVAPDDVVLMLGDVCYQKAPEYLPLVAQMNGRKTLVRGNHDRVFSDEQLKPYFEKIYPDGEGFRLQIGENLCYLTHYPTQGVEGAFNLVGHIHGIWKLQLNSLNVGVDVHHFRPVNAERIAFHKTAIEKYYDEDVWVGYHGMNASYRGKRGKAGSYFSPA